MDPVPHPLDWWAYGGYDEVVRQTGWTRPHARREVRKVIRQLGLNPIGHAGYRKLRQQILDNQILDSSLS